MRSQYLTATEERRKRAEFRKAIGRVIYSIIILTMIAMLLIRIDTVMRMQTDAMEQLNYIRLEVETVDMLSGPEEGQLDLKGFFENPVGAVHPLTDTERELVTRVTMAEARGDGYPGMVAVAQTIIDRATLWDMTITEVVTAEGQFAGPYQGDISFEAQLAISDAFDLGVRIFDEPVTHFHNVTESPYWTTGKENRGTIGNHLFYY